MVQGDRRWKLQSVHNMLFLLLLPSQEEDSSHSSPAPVWGPSHERQSSTSSSNMSPSHRMQFFTNWSSVGPFHGLQPFRNGLLQYGSLTGSQVLPANRVQCGLFSPWVCRSYQEPPPDGLPMGSQPPLCASTCSGVESSTGCRWISFPLWTSMGCRDISALVPRAPPPAPSSLTLVSAELLFSHILTTLSGCNCCGFSSTC